MRGTLGFTLGSIFLVAACVGRQTGVKSINGTWESIGSGWLLEIRDSSTYAFYDVTSISCLPTRRGDLDEVLNTLILDGDTLLLKKGVMNYKFIRANDLPVLCLSTSDEDVSKDPLYNFDVFAETVRDHYAFFELNDVNWEELYLAQRGKLSDSTSALELYNIIEETLEKLNDNHAFLEAPDSIFQQLDQQVPAKEQETYDGIVEYGDFQVAGMVANHHLQEEMTENSWLIQWGKLTDSIGFVEVKAMWLYADLDVPGALVDQVGFVDAYVETFHKMYEGDYIEREVQGVKAIMDKLMHDLSDMSAVVIDIRFNGGGQDAVSFEILKRFMPKKLKVAKQKLRYRNQYTPVFPIYIDGTSWTDKKPLYILTSQQTGSAAEAFAIASMALTNAKRLGGPTQGATSTALEKVLPNGWKFAFSNEVYMDTRGKCYENTGIPVDFDLNYAEDRQTFFRSVVDDLEADKKNILQAIEKFEAE